MTRPTFPSTPLYQRTVSPLREGRRLRDEAIAQVEAHSPHWRVVAWDALMAVARGQRELSSEDVWRVLDTWGVPRPVEPRAVGPVMLRARKEGVIEPMGWTNGTDPKHHRDPLRMYRSMVCRS